MKYFIWASIEMLFHIAWIKKIVTECCQIKHQIGSECYVDVHLLGSTALSFVTTY